MIPRASRHLIWTTPTAGAPAAALAAVAGAAPTPKPSPAADEEFQFDAYRAPRAQALYLLRLVAEVEHALMVQYLFAAWSLGGPHVQGRDHLESVRSWRKSILDIAREEMAHLATVENLVTLLGGAPSFAREDYPIPADLYPFPLELEPLRKSALAKYVLAEMPSEAILERHHLTEEIDKIRKSLKCEKGIDVHRVGKLYDKLTRLFTLPSASSKGPAQPEPFIANADIQATSAPYQVRPGEWGLGYPDLLILPAATRGDALTAIKQISDQGEGTGLSKETSHFAKFLEIFRKFPRETEWIPARNLACNPTTDETNAQGTYIKDCYAQTWARLFNVRYQMLLMFLAHSFAIEGGSGKAASNSKGLLISWAFGEMYNLRSIAEVLMSLPIASAGGKFAGPPFEMPSSLDLAPREPNRWRTHRDLLLASQYYIDELLGRPAASAQETYLRGLHSANARALQQTLKQIDI